MEHIIDSVFGEILTVKNKFFIKYDWMNYITKTLKITKFNYDHTILSCLSITNKFQQDVHTYLKKSFAYKKGILSWVYFGISHYYTLV